MNESLLKVSVEHKLGVGVSFRAKLCQKDLGERVCQNAAPAATTTLPTEPGSVFEVQQPCNLQSTVK